MRPAQKQSRARGRGSRKNGGGGGGNNLNRVYDSAGPEGKVRGTPQQIVDKYLSLARDAQTAGDRVTAENFLQHAEHYQRIILTAMGAQAEQRREANGQATEEEAETSAPAAETAVAAEEVGSTTEDQPEPRGRRRRGRRGDEAEAAAEEGARNGAASAHTEKHTGHEIGGFGTIEPEGGEAGADLLIESDEISRSQPRRAHNGGAPEESSVSATDGAEAQGNGSTQSRPPADGASEEA